MKLNIVLFLAGLNIFFMLSNLGAAWFEEDTIYLFEDGKRITDASVILWSNPGSQPICREGKCVRGQQFSKTLTFYKINGPIHLCYDEEHIQGCIDHAVYHTTITLPETEYDVFLKEQNAKQKEQIAQAPAISQEVINYVASHPGYEVGPTMSPSPLSEGPIGTPRCFNVDIKTESVEEIACP